MSTTPYTTLTEKEQALPTKLLVLIALLQGLGLLFLHQAIDFEFWPAQSPPWLLTLYSVFLALPTMLLLSLTQANLSKILPVALMFALVIGLLAYYTGYQLLPIGKVRADALYFVFSLTIGIALFKALIYLQQYVSQAPMHYSELFRWSWRNFLTLGLAILFASVFWLILFLWGALFKAIGLNFFETLFRQTWFYYPAITLANGFGIIIFRNLAHIIDTITRLQQALMKFLLVILIFISILFLSALPFTGLNVLWESGGSMLILWMQALMLFFLNAVYQDDSSARPYPLWLHRFIYVGVALLPVYSMISFYGLSLRVDQYGWSLARCWAFLVWLILALFPLGYLWGIARLRDAWLSQLSRVNIVVGLIVLGLMLLINSPLLDFRKFVVNNHLEKLAANPDAVDELDIRYFYSRLARPGYLALQDLKIQYRDTHPDFVRRIESKGTIRKNTSKEEFIEKLIIIDAEPPTELLDIIYRKFKKETWAPRNAKNRYIAEVELNNDLSKEFLLVRETENHTYVELYIFNEGKWIEKPIGQTGQYKQDFSEFIDALKNNEITTIEPQWRDVQIGDKRYRVR